MTAFSFLADCSTERKQNKQTNKRLAGFTSLNIAMLSHAVTVT